MSMELICLILIKSIKLILFLSKLSFGVMIIVPVEMMLLQPHSRLYKSQFKTLIAVSMKVWQWLTGEESFE